MIAIAVLVSLGFAFLMGLAWGALIERDAQTRFGAPRPLPVAQVVTRDRLDITPALQRRSR